MVEGMQAVRWEAPGHVLTNCSPGASFVAKSVDGKGINGGEAC